jgi:hypothetical protein
MRAGGTTPWIPPRRAGDARCPPWDRREVSKRGRRGRPRGAVRTASAAGSLAVREDPRGRPRQRHAAPARGLAAEHLDAGDPRGHRAGRGDDEHLRAPSLGAQRVVANVPVISTRNAVISSSSSQRPQARRRAELAQVGVDGVERLGVRQELDRNRLLDGLSPASTIPRAQHSRRIASSPCTRQIANMLRIDPAADVDDVLRMQKGAGGRQGGGRAGTATGPVGAHGRSENAS